MALAGCEVLTLNSFNAFMFELMPKSLLERLQRFEFRHYQHFPLRTAPMRRLGADLKIRARIAKQEG
jgi:hypothetical protein